MRRPRVLMEAIRRVKLPCFIYDLPTVRAQIDNIKKFLVPCVRVYYAMKANPLEGILKILRDEHWGVETTSIGEMEHAFAAGFLPTDLLLAGPGKSDDVLEFAVRHGVAHVIVESLHEVERLDRIAGSLRKRQPVLVRVSPADRMENSDLENGFALFGGKPVKFGIDEEDLQDALPALMRFENIDPAGLHVFAASGVRDYSLLVKHVTQISFLASRIASSFPQFSVIDFGGGFGYAYDDSYEFDVASYFAGLEDSLPSVVSGMVQYYLELGTYIAAPCGTYVAEIMDVKRSRDEYFIIVDGGIHHILRPALVSNHAAQIFDAAGTPIQTGDGIRVNIAGNLCHPLDNLSKGISIKMDPGCLDGLIRGKVAIYNCGAYGANFSVGDFTLRQKPNIYVIEE